ncbi:hypothetical protein SAICODRAFT_10043 [Saitoella complicata NRRL Y-17804]|uniref:C2H2-type domain-containing protein n=1 Tax=Saitoella complicata (strain BCRC 22490 / CBS 7301 / JCM 7358 / NBRC 10748 / NRRL Y-17804) TaxID=698492 RepID=A0A0E9NJZ3_SAICN|nr:uncharacterized protein SAICODRAFT_10043 [Saitoella complicata NRRL Y-17804]ODQ50244.1 hypothetical protein SAICODRAFT_10043 [Saitoella complicata NRRL Y-17804]GAO50202.1 hypothetical protein G7K_4336-t1 [Saitoella complicata NRRL Y-17804]
MGKKNKKQTQLDELLEKPWCWYCERTFDDLKILLNHQRSKHYQCEHCNRKLNTAGGLNVHVQQVHKETLIAIANTIPGREGIDIEIFGMEGVPENDLIQRNARIMQEYHATQGSATPQQHGGPPVAKKQKIDKVDTADLKAKMEAFRAAKAAKAAGVSPSAATPTPHPATPSTTGTPTPAPGYTTPLQPPSVHAYVGAPYPQVAAPPAASPYDYPPQYAQYYQHPMATQQPAYPAYPAAAPGLPARPPASIPSLPSRPPAAGLPSKPSVSAGIGSPAAYASPYGTSPYHAPSSTVLSAVADAGARTAITNAKTEQSKATDSTNPADASKIIAKDVVDAEKPSVEKQSSQESAERRDSVLVYDDNEVSPEEKRSKLPKYAYNAEKEQEKAEGLDRDVEGRIDNLKEEGKEAL